MADDVLDVPFEPCWLYHSDFPEGRLVETADLYAHLRQQGGWVETPALLGITTNPNVEQQILLEATRKPTGAPLLPPSADSLVLGLYSRVQALEEGQAVLQRQSEEQASELEALHGLLQGFQTQLDTLTSSGGDARQPSGRK